MTDVDAKLVDQITAAVLQALGRSGVGDAAPASIHAPIGTCAGDYSKFSELAADGARPLVVAAAPSVTAAEGATGGKAGVSGLVLAGLVTANRLKGLQGTVLYLAAGARLSPLAMDEVKQRKLRVERLAGDGSSGTPAIGTTQAGATWCCWVQGHCATAARVMEQYGGRPISVASVGNSKESLPRVIRRMARSLRQGEFRLAVVFVLTAGVAACMANRCEAVRAVVGTTIKGVEEGVAELGANLLVIEYPQHGYQAMAGMLAVFLRSTGAAPPLLERELLGLAADTEV
ncbi:MAG: hypothetical protein HKL95_02030 [Phycisphaerae bacterium]|nr:hypothetical protein [Phycisphaerae bacterium]